MYLFTGNSLWVLACSWYYPQAIKEIMMIQVNLDRNIHGVELEQNNLSVWIEVI